MSFLKNLVVHKSMKSKEGLAENQFHNILTLSNAVPNFPFTTSEMNGDYYL